MQLFSSTVLMVSNGPTGFFLLNVSSPGDPSVINSVDPGGK